MRPFCLDPLAKGGRAAFDPREKAEPSAEHFEDKLTARTDGTRLSSETAKGWVIRKPKTGYMELLPGISRGEAGLAAKDLPGNKAVGPGEFPAEFYNRCHVLREILAFLFNGMLETITFQICPEDSTWPPRAKQARTPRCVKIRDPSLL